MKIKRNIINRRKNDFIIHTWNSVTFICNSLRYLGPDIWKALPKYSKKITSFEKFEETITNWYGSSSKYTNTSGCTNLIYHADLDILWLLVWDSQAQCGQWSQYVYEILCILSQHHFLICLLENFLLVGSGLLARMWYLLWRDLPFHPSFSSVIFLGFVIVLICFQ